MRKLLVIAPVLSLAPTAALAGYPDDVRLSQLATYNGQAVGSAPTKQEAYRTVVRELAAAIANKPMAAAETTGLAGFDVAFTSSVGFINAHSDDELSPSPWERVHADGDPTDVLWIPTLSARKGLPLSLEMGANLGYVAFSRQTVFGGYGRWGLVEGYKQFPDLSVQVGYSGYVGNEELELGVMDMSTTIGYTFPFGQLEGINEAKVSPYAGVGVLRINAAPRMSETQQEELGISAVSGFKNKDSYVEGEGFAPLQVHLGTRVQTGDFQILLAATLVPKAITTVNMGFGYVY